MKALLPIFLGFLTAVVTAQERAASPPASSIKLPAADQGKPFAEKDAIVVEVFRAGGAPDPSPPRPPSSSSDRDDEIGRGWGFRLNAATYGTESADLERLRADIFALVRPGISAETGRSARAFLIRSDFEAPHACITTLRNLAEVYAIDRLFFAVRKRADGGEQALACPLPRNPGSDPEPGATRINLKWFEWRPATERVVVTAGQWASPNEKSLDDDRALTNALSAGTTKGAVIIDVDKQVPWQRVIDVVDAAHRLGRNRIEFIGGGRLSGAGMIGLGPRTGAARTEKLLGDFRMDRRTEQADTLQATEKAVMSGLEWLKRHQSPDGSWSAGGFSSTCDASLGPACTGGGNRALDLGVTGWALLAFLGAGYDARRPGPYLDTVRNGLKHLKSFQDAEGRFRSAAGDADTYAHSCITIAMCEAYASSRQLPWRKSADQAVNYIHACHIPGGGWRSGNQPGETDASATGWMLMALAAAKDAGIPIDETKVKQGLALLASITDLDTGRIGSLKAGERSARPEGSAAKWPPAESEALTALGICAQIFHRQPISPLWIAGAELLNKKPAVWDETNGSIAMDYWYWGTLTMFQLGDPRWDRWNTSLKTSAIDHQVMRGCAEGSWDPKGPSGAEGGRVYSTAMMTLCLETYYRYPRRR